MTVVTAPCGALIILGASDDSRRMKRAIFADHATHCQQPACAGPEP